MEKKNNSNKYSQIKYYSIIFCLFIIIGITYFQIIFDGYILGSTMDWVNQHVAFAQYFRDLFYEYNIILPQFSFHIGAGQNFYNFAYHGLLNPLIMLSFLFPFIQMVDYISLLGFMSFIFTGFLMHYWLLKNNYSKMTSLCVSLIIMFSGPISFHVHRHYMFISYIPFMIIGLIGIDYFFKKNIRTLFIISVTLAILTNFFYAPGFSAVFFIYAMYKYILTNEKIRYPEVIKYGFKIFNMYIIGILISSILIIPTFISIISNRASSINTINILDLIIPVFNPGYILYSPYNLGLIFIFIIALFINLNSTNKAIKFMSITLLFVVSVPLFIYILNGTLYLRPKALIPFIPLFGLLLAYTFDNLKNYKSKTIIIIICLIVPLIFFEYYFKFFNFTILLFDLIITLIALIFIILTQQKKSYIIFVFLLIMIISSSMESRKEHFLTRDFYNSRSGSKELVTMIKNTLKNEDSFYRFNNLVFSTYYTPNTIYDMSFNTTSIYSSNYSYEYYNFLRNEFNISHSSTAHSPFLNTNNVLFNTLMGVKYIASHRNKEGIGYTNIKNNNDIAIYKNDNVFPIGFSNNNILSYNEYIKLSYPKRQEALLNYIVINNEFTNNSYETKINDYSLDIDNVDIPNNLHIKKINNKYEIVAEENTKMTIYLKEPIINKVLFIEFDILNEIECGNRAKLMIGINTVNNTLSCRTSHYYNNNNMFNYAISSSSGIIDKLEINFHKGIYEINNIKFYTLNYDYIENSVNNIDKLNVKRSNMTTNYLKGNIDVTEDGWFTFTIPYDKGFNIKVNNKLIDYEKVNAGFIGFPISKGSHIIELEYIAPGYNIGKIMTIIGIVLLFRILLIDYKKIKGCVSNENN